MRKWEGDGCSSEFQRDKKCLMHIKHIQHIGKLTERNAVIKNTFIKFFMIERERESEETGGEEI